MKKTLLSFLALLACCVADARSDALPSGVVLNSRGYPFIYNIWKLIATCPQSDEATPIIRSDFLIRRNGQLVADIPCTTPISSMPISQYTDELIILQGLRVIYYMDYGETGNLLWTPFRLYEWLKTKIGGFDLIDGIANSECCHQISGLNYISIQPQESSSREFDRSWLGISDNISLYAHEARHVDGYPHITCSGSSADDNNYDIKNLTCRGVQWWLQHVWLKGGINVGAACKDAQTTQEVANWYGSALNMYRNSFCHTKPEAATWPPKLGAPCVPVIISIKYLRNMLILSGFNFVKGAKVAIGTTSYRASLSRGTLTLTNAGRYLGTGKTVNVSIRNPDGTKSGRVRYRRIIGRVVPASGVSTVMRG